MKSFKELIESGVSVARKWYKSVLCGTAVAMADDDVKGPPLYVATEIPDDELTQTDEAYHDSEAAGYDSYSEIPRVAVAESWIQPWLVKSSLDGVIVDLGAGTGRVAQHLAVGGRHVIAVDRSRQMLLQARPKLPADRAVLLRADARALPIEDSAVDTVVCSGVLHHIPAWPDAIHEIARVLKPGGRLIVREPNARYPEKLFAPFERAIEAIVKRVRVRAGQTEQTWDPNSLSPVETPVRLTELAREADRYGLKLQWHGSAMFLGSLGLPDEMPLQRAYFKFANLVDRAALALTHQPYGSLVLAIFVANRS